MWISKKKIAAKLDAKLYEVQREEWRLRDEHNQNTRIHELNTRVTSLEIKAGLKPEPKSCCCGPEEVALG
jgi:hypothetical protein